MRLCACGNEIEQGRAARCNACRFTKPAKRLQGHPKTHKTYTRHKPLWRDIQGFEGRYRISDKGQIQSFMKSTPHMMTLRRQDGRPYVELICPDGRRVKRYILRLMLQAFCPLSDDRGYIPQCKSENPDDLSLVNWEWVKQTGEGNPLSVLSESLVRTIRGALMANADITYAQISKRYAVSVDVVKDLMCGKTWKHVK